MAKMLDIIFRPDIIKRSFLVAIVVGTVLNLINQGDLFLDTGTVDGLKCILTYLVPYCVATYGAVTALRNNPEC